MRAKVLPTIDLLWLPTVAERLYDSAPMFRPGAVAAWAVSRYPAFPYRKDPWLTETIGRNLTKLCVECDRPVEHLANLMETDRSNVQDHLNGRVRPGLSTITAYARVFTELLKRPIDLAGLKKDWPDEVCPLPWKPKYPSDTHGIPSTVLLNGAVAPLLSARGPARSQSCTLLSRHWSARSSRRFCVSCAGTRRPSRCQFRRKLGREAQPPT